MVASLNETCKLVGVEPQVYLTDAITRIVAGHPNSRHDELLHWSYPETPALKRINADRIISSKPSDKPRQQHQARSRLLLAAALTAGQRRRRPTRSSAPKRRKILCHMLARSDALTWVLHDSRTHPTRACQTAAAPRGSRRLNTSSPARTAR